MLEKALSGNAWCVVGRGFRASGDVEFRVGPGCGQPGARDAAHGLAAESAQADFVCLLRRIYSLCKAAGTEPCSIRPGTRWLSGPWPEPRPGAAAMARCT
jgi:hypothetical protein